MGIEEDRRLEGRRDGTRTPPTIFLKPFPPFTLRVFPVEGSPTGFS